MQGLCIGPALAVALLVASAQAADRPALPASTAVATQPVAAASAAKAGIERQEIRAQLLPRPHGGHAGESRQPARAQKPADGGGDAAV